MEVPQAGRPDDPFQDLQRITRGGVGAQDVSKMGAKHSARSRGKDRGLAATPLLPESGAKAPSLQTGRDGTTEHLPRGSERPGRERAGSVWPGAPSVGSGEPEERPKYHNARRPCQIR